MMAVQFVLVKDGKEDYLITNQALISIPGTGDIIDDPAPGEGKLRVESVVHRNVLSSSGEHKVIVTLKEI